MNTEKLYYTDGRDVVVTATFLKTHHKIYRLAGIIRHNLSTLAAPRAPGLIIFILGITVGFVGLAALVPAGILPPAHLAGKWFTVNDFVIILGALMAIAGLVILAVGKRRYAVHITTATEEEDIIVSSQREYIASIVDGLDRAMMERSVEL